MEHYDLRACFLPDLSGLHVRIHQFRELLKQHVPTLAAHLETLQIEPAYVSQWFLSFFAVTCPLPMLFRIYDVIFAEGASETIMRVALSLMRKNEAKLMACSEFEDAMQLLLSRGLWDCYHYNADEFVNDFVSLTGIVTHESIQALEASYKESQSPSDIGSAASRFLGRLWVTKSTLSPGSSTPSRPISFLRRTPSKQSIASTLNSIEAGSESVLSSNESSISRDSSNTDGSSLRTTSASFGMAKSDKDKGLHSQIEDLLTALSEMQRDHAILASQLQNEREEREEDRNAVKSLLNALRRKADGEDAPVEDLTSLLDIVEDRFSTAIDDRRSSMLQTKPQMQEELVRSKEQLHIVVTKTQDLTRQVSDQGQEIHNLQDEVREGHTHIRNAHAEKQRLEKQIHDLRARKRVPSPDRAPETEHTKPSGGLRELKLGRQNSASRSMPTFGKRTSSLAHVHHDAASPAADSASDHESLVLELVQSKTAEAVARQEAEEAKAKLEGLRKMLGGNGDALAGLNMSTGHKASSSQASAPVSVGGAWASWSGWGKRVVSEKVGVGG